MSKLFKSKFLFGLMIVALLVVGAFATTADAAITKTLKMGMKDAQVMELQQWLNANGYVVSSTGAGSPGMESMYFGSKTKAAVMAFQSANGLVADGVFGPMSRAATTGSVVGGGSGMTYPAGCTSNSGYSSTTGMSCSSGTSMPAGCMPGYMYSATTGMPCSGSTTTTQTGPVTAMLASSNPASGTLVAGQATADLAHFAFSGTGTVTNVVLKRLGVSADTTPSNVYLFDGAMRLTDAASVANNGLVTFNNASGLFSVAGMKTIAVKSDIASGGTGQTVGFQLVSFTVSGGTAVNANLAGNVHTIASASLATVTLSGTVTPSGATLNPGAGVTVWQGTFNVATRDVMMKRVAFRNVGSAPASAFANFKLFVNGVQVATATGLDANGYATFDLMSSPVNLVSGARVVRVDADIVSGASRTVNFSLRQAADVDLVDSSFGVNITPALTGTALPWVGTASTISGSSGGTLTIEKDVTSPSTTVVNGGSDVVLGVFKVTAYGEAIKLETIRAAYTGSANIDDDDDSLRNARLLIGGVQYGSTASLNETTDGTLAYTSFTLNYTVMPGTPVLMELRADIYDDAGTNDIVAGTDTVVPVIAVGSSNAQRMDSLGSFNAPGTAVSGNTLTVASTTATLSKNTTYANQTVTLPTTSFKIGSWNLTGSSVEDILLTTLSFDVDEDSTDEFDEGDLTNVYVVVKNGSTVVAQPAPLSTASTGADLNFSVNYTLPKNAVVTIELFANMADDGLNMVAGVSGGADAIDSGDAFGTDLTVTGTALVSGTGITATSADTAGQTITYGAASVTASADASNPVASIVYDNQTVTTLAAKFATVTAGYNVTDITVTVTEASAVSAVELYDGATLVASRPGATSVSFSGLNWNIPANTNKVLTVKLVLGTVGIGAGNTGATITTAITAFTAVNTSTGVSGAGTVSSANGSATYVYAATPTITNVTLPESTLSNGTKTVAKFSVASNGGTVGWKYFAFTITKVMSGTDTLASATLWDADTNTQIAGTATFTGSVEADNDTAGGLTFVADNEQQISGTKTYVLKMTVAGATTSGDYLSVSIAQPLTAYDAPDAYADVLTDDATATFVWTDQSASAHDATTDDWNHGYLVKNLPTDTQVLTY